MEEIKPCPFCGSKPVLITTASRIEKLERVSLNGYYYYCYNCHTMCGFNSDYVGIYKTQEEALNAWNKRDKPTKIYLIVNSIGRNESYRPVKIFVTYSEEKAKNYVEKFNTIRTKWLQYYDDIIDKHVKKEKIIPKDSYIFERSFTLINTNECIYKEIEVR